MKKMRWLAMLRALVMIAAACGSDDESSDAGGDDGSSDTTAAPADDDGSDTTAAADDDGATDTTEDVAVAQGGDLTFLMMTLSDEGPLWTVVQFGAEAAAAAMGVNLVWLASNNDPGVQAQMIDQAISEGSDGIASSLPSPDQLVPGLQAAVGGGIPVYTLNSGVNDYQDIGATTHVGQTEFIAGQGAGLRFNDLGATSILCGRQEESNVALEERCDGLADTFSGEVISEFMGLDQDAAAQEANINALLSANPQIDGFMGAGPVIGLSGLRASEALGRGLTIGAFDITPEIIDAIDAGTISFTVDQQQYLQGYLPIVLLFLEVTNKNTAGGGLPILTGPGFVDTSNVAAVADLVAQSTR